MPAVLDLSTTNFVVLDVETTGLKPATDRVCEVGAIKYMAGKEKDRYQTFVDPERPMPKSARAVHGITEEMLSDAPPFEKIAPDLRKFLAQTVLVAHNASFDVSFLNAGFERAGMSRLMIPVVDTIALARKVRPGLWSYNLDSLAKHFRVKISDRHRSIGDCEVTGKIFWKCFDALRPKSLEELVRKGKGR